MKIILVLPLIITACAIKPEPFIGPNGKQAYYMACGGSDKGLAKCFKKAGELCPGGYSIIDRSSRTMGVPQMNGGTMIASRQTLAVQCK